jgi:hypothetical protein
MYDLVEMVDGSYTLTITDRRLENNVIVESNYSLAMTMTLDTIRVIANGDQYSNIGIICDDMAITLSDYDFREVFILCFAIMQDKNMPEPVKVDETVVVKGYATDELPTEIIEFEVDQFEAMGMNLLRDLNVAPLHAMRSV